MYAAVAASGEGSDAVAQERDLQERMTMPGEGEHGPTTFAKGARSPP
jgi:hypothetical protein